MHWERPQAVGWGRPNLCIVLRRKCQRPSQNMGWLGGQKTKHPNLALHKISAKHNDNWKTTLKRCWKMNAHACFPRCFLENNLFLSNSCSNGGMEAWTFGGKMSQVHLRWVWNESGHELFAFITPNKNGQPFYKNLDAMIRVISP
jgi:hypothetical protein